MEFKHESIMVKEVLDGLSIHPDGIYVDGTLGGGGHSFQIAQRLEGGKVIGIDQDIEAIHFAKKRLQLLEDRFCPYQANFSQLSQVLDALDIKEIDGFLLDLGVSSYQLDNPQRGFSYMADAPLDMRMNQSQDFSAFQVVNEYSIEDLIRIIREYGEEKWAHRIATKIVENRPIETTGELVESIKAAIPASARRNGPHPAKRTFQAIRIEVNKELEILENSIREAVQRLKKGGRIVILTFHSLEDRIVKNTFKDMARTCDCPPNAYRCTCNRKPEIAILTKKPILPTKDEIKLNPRARSSKLRIAEKVE